MVDGGPLVELPCIRDLLFLIYTQYIPAWLWELDLCRANASDLDHDGEHLAILRATTHLDFPPS